MIRSSGERAVIAIRDTVIVRAIVMIALARDEGVIAGIARTERPQIIRSPYEQAEVLRGS